MLSLVAVCEQFLSYRYSRLLVTMEKTKVLDEAEEAAFAAQFAPPECVGYLASPPRLSYCITYRLSIDLIPELVLGQRACDAQGQFVDALGRPCSAGRTHNKRVARGKKV